MEVIPQVVTALTGYDPLVPLAAYPGPVWLINGGNDPLRRDERRFHSVCANGRLLVVPGTGHLMPVTHPEIFNRLVLDAATILDASAAVPRS